MIAKGKAISHGGNALEYALREGKLEYIVGRNMIDSDDPTDILHEFEHVNQHNYRCKNKFLRFEIGIAPQDICKLAPGDMMRIAINFAHRMGLDNHQWIACTHKDSDKPHIHLIANRIGVDGAVFDTTFISNRSARIAEELSRDMGLTIANEVRTSQRHQEVYSNPERQQAKEKLQNIAYSQLCLNTTLLGFIQGLSRQGVSVEEAKNKQGKTYGLRFSYDEHTFKASEIGREFGYHSLAKNFGATQENSFSSSSLLRQLADTQYHNEHGDAQNYRDIEQNPAVSFASNLFSSHSSIEPENDFIKKPKKKKRGRRL